MGIIPALHEAVPYIKTKKKPVKIISKNNISRLNEFMESLETNTSNVCDNFKNALLKFAFQLYLNEGVRKEESIKLDVSDFIGLGTDEITLEIQGKCNRPRQIMLSKETGKALEAYLIARKKYLEHRNRPDLLKGALLISMKLNRMSPTQLWRIISQLKDKVGLVNCERFYVHKLRANCISGYAEALAESGGAYLAEVGKMLGVSIPVMENHYIAVSQENLAKAKELKRKAA